MESLDYVLKELFLEVFFPVFNVFFCKKMRLKKKSPYDY